MEDVINYSSQRIRDTRKSCLELIKQMEQRIEAIRRITGEDPAELKQALNCYMLQMEHLNAAADLYDRCSVKVVTEAEEVVKRGGA